MSRSKKADQAISRTDNRESKVESLLTRYKQVRDFSEELCWPLAIEVGDDQQIWRHLGHHFFQTGHVAVADDLNNALAFEHVAQLIALVVIFLTDIDGDFFQHFFIETRHFSFKIPKCSALLARGAIITD